jgi:hypothetical protein
MLLLPVPWKGKLKLLVVLQDENVERIKQHDCAEVIWAHLGQYQNMRPESITIGYASPDEMQQIVKWAEAGEIVECIKLVTGGFKYRPEAGDHDFGPVSLKKEKQ